MKTELLRVDPNQPESAIIQKAAESLRQGKLVAFPTETVYGLGANALNETTVQGIFHAKGRPSNNPLIVHVKNIEQACKFAAVWPDTAQALAESFWPGTLTLVVPGNGMIPSLVTAGGPTIALRVPAHPVALALLEAAEFPLAAPSANRSNQLSPTLAEHVLRDLEGRIDLILDGGPAWGGIESTVLDLTVTPPRLLRPGLITVAQLNAIIGDIALPDGAATAEHPQPIRSPGMFRKHYAPRAPLELHSPQSTRNRVEELVQQGLRVGWLTFHSRPESLGHDVAVFKISQEVRLFSAQLYAVLHQLDAAGVDRIVVDAPPETEEWRAVRDRLERAATRCQ